MGIIFANFAAARLAAAIDKEAVTIEVVNAAALPALGEGEYFYAELVGAEAQREVIRVSAVAGNILTVARAQDQSEGRGYNAGDLLELRLTRVALGDWTKETVAAVEAQTHDMLAVAVPEILESCKARVGEVIDGQIPVGAVFCLMSQTPGELFSVLDVTALSRADCPDLFALWGETFGAGDGATTFGKPDARGRFVRFCNFDADVDPEAETRAGGNAPGSTQDDQFASHNHGANMGIQGIAEGRAWAWGDREHHEPINATIVQTAGGTETRPKNIAMVPVVKVRKFTE